MMCRKAENILCIDMQSRFLWGYHYEGLFKTLPGEICVLSPVYIGSGEK